jgi:hypothetical protein
MKDAGQEIPGDSISLWRYIDLAHFLNLLDAKSLYFARLSQLPEDPWEGRHPSQLRERLKRLRHPNAIEDLYKLNNERCVISCWHEGEHESVAMWALYTSGPNGIALKTTVGQLKSAIRHNYENMQIARVRYIDYATEDVETGPAFNLSAPYFYKRRGFEHEREVRVAILPVHVFEDVTEKFIGLTPELPANGGLNVDVDLPTLIQRIVVSPRYPDWCISALAKIVEETGLSVRVEPSSLKAGPII